MNHRYWRLANEKFILLVRLGHPSVWNAFLFPPVFVFDLASSGTCLFHCVLHVGISLCILIKAVEVNVRIRFDFVEFVACECEWNGTCWIARLSGSKIAPFCKTGMAALMSPFASNICAIGQCHSIRLQQFNFVDMTAWPRTFNYQITFPFLNNALTFSGWHLRTLSTETKAVS